MKNIFIALVAIIIFLPEQTIPQNLIISQKMIKKRSNVDFPDVPRISAKKAFLLFKSGNAIIVHSGGSKFENRHIHGAINISQEAIRQGKRKLPRLPSKGKYIITYCY